MVLARRLLPPSAALLLAACGDGAGPAAEGWTDVAAGYLFTCALTADGRAFCWGYGGEGQLGNGATASSPAPVPVSGGHRFTRISAQGRSVCALAGDGATWCWGDNSAGQLGVASGGCMPAFPAQDCASAPIRAAVPALATVTMGSGMACGVAHNAELWCWGTGRFALDSAAYPTAITAPRPVADPAAGYRDVVVGADFACGMSGGALRCFGTGEQGQFGMVNPPACVPPSSYRCSFAPAALGPGYAWMAATAAAAHACAIDSGGTLGCWGAAAYGALGLGPTTAVDTPRAVFTPAPFSAVATGPDHTCGVTPPGVQCWGRGDHGQVGDVGNFQQCPAPSGGTVACRTIPTTVPGAPANVIRLAAGVSHSCAVTAEGALWCWGRGDTGALGDGAGTSSAQPVEVDLP